MSFVRVDIEDSLTPALISKIPSRPRFFCLHSMYSGAHRSYIRLDIDAYSANLPNQLNDRRRIFSLRSETRIIRAVYFVIG